jgi:hypothetical protein
MAVAITDGFRGRRVTEVILKGRIGAIMILAVIVMMRVERIIFVFMAIAQRRFFGRVLGFFAQQSFAIFFGDLIIIRVDFTKRQKAVTIPAIIDKSRLKRRLYSGNFGEIDIAFELATFGRLKVKFFNPVSFDDGHTGFFPVAGVD